MGLSSGMVLIACGNIITGRFVLVITLEISLKKLRFSFVILFLFIEIEPIFFKYHPKIGIKSNSFFKTKTGELNIVCRKKVSNIDWCDDAIKNFSSVKIFSFPLIVILVESIIFKQMDDQ